MFSDDDCSVDDRLVSNVASAGVATAHATTSESTQRRRWLHHPSDATPTPREAARRLAWFTEEMQLKRMSPLIASPPRQKVATKRQPLPKRSRRIPLSRWGIFRPPSGARCSSYGGWALHRRQVQSHPHPRELTMTFSRGTERRAKWKHWTSCSRRPLRRLVQGSSRMTEQHTKQNLSW